MGRKGEKIRPCHVCGHPVNFVFWKMRGKTRIFHWANPDGSHHAHADSYPELSDEQKHMLSILREQPKVEASSIQPWD